MATDLIMQSNRQSVVLRSLAQSEEDFSYEIPPSAPLISKQIREQVSQNVVSGAPHGQEVTFNLNRSALLRDLLIETTVTSGSTFSTSVGPLGLRLFESIIIRSNNKTIFTLSDAYLMARTVDMDYAKSQAIFARALTRNTTSEAVVTNATSVKVYTPIFCSFFESIREHLDLNFYEQIQVVCKFNSQARMALPAALTGATSTIWTWSYMMDDPSYSKLRAKNQRPGGLLNMLTYNTFLERTTCTGATSNSVRFNLNYPCFKTYFFVRSNTAVDLDFARIDQVTLRIGGSALIENVSSLVANYEAEKSGASHAVTVDGSAITRFEDNIWCLNWGLLPQNRVANSGAISWAQISSAVLELTHESVTAANYDIYVVHEYWQLLSMSTENGTVDVSSYS